MIHTKVFTKSSKGKIGSWEKALGKFYTPQFIIEDLYTDLTKLLKFNKASVIKVIDPFCGDGRMLLAFVKKINELKLNAVKFEIVGWDCDSLALEVAHRSLTEAINLYSLKNVRLSLEKKDSFIKTSFYFSKYDIVVTNPPWETIKPDSRDLKSLTEEQIKVYRSSLKKYDQQLLNSLPISQPTKKFAGWGTNLSRCGLELSIKLLKKDGFGGIVLPLSVFMDQTSSPLRKWLYSEVNINKINLYPAESRLFTFVDQDSVSLTFKKQVSKSNLQVEVKKYTKDLKSWTNEILKVSIESLKEFDYTLPMLNGNNAYRLLEKWSIYKSLKDLEYENKLWLGRELDETRLNDFLKKTGKFLFVKGKMIDRYGLLIDQKRYVNESIKNIPESALFSRITWRDIARKNQERRVKANLIPASYVTGNSLHVARILDNDKDKLNALLVLMNSFVFEFQIRCLHGTEHISLGAVRKVKIPNIEDKKLSNKLSNALNLFNEGKLEGGEGTLEVMAALEYKVTLNDFKEILKSFDKISKDYFNSLIEHPLWVNEKTKIK